MNLVAVDTGAIVALLSARDRYHQWARDSFSRLQPPLVTCEAVLTETCHLLRALHGGTAAVLGLLSAGVLEIRFDLAAEVRLAALQSGKAVPFRDGAFYFFPHLFRILSRPVGSGCGRGGGKRVRMPGRRGEAIAALRLGKAQKE